MKISCLVSYVKLLLINMNHVEFKKKKKSIWFMLINSNFIYETR